MSYATVRRGKAICTITRKCIWCICISQTQLLLFHRSFSWELEKSPFFKQTRVGAQPLLRHTNEAALHAKVLSTGVQNVIQPAYSRFGRVLLTVKS